MKAILLLFFLTGCVCIPKSDSWKEQYAHLESHKPGQCSNSPSQYYLMVLVDARHLDYSDGAALLKTLVKHPSDGSKNSDVGHAWILLKGVAQGRCIFVEGGHSGESGMCQPRYFEGIMNNIEYGCPDPSYEEKRFPAFEPDPIKYLWEVRRDGFFQKGAGGHRPTYAVKVNLSRVQFEAILSYMDPRNYDYSHYSLSGSQCSTFAKGAAKIAGLELSCETTLPIPKRLLIGKESFTLWQDPFYSEITFSTPDSLEKSMMLAVEEGRAEYALPLYLRKWKKRKCPRCHLRLFFETVSCFPYRYERARLFLN